MIRAKPDLTIKPNRLVTLAFQVVYALIIVLTIFGTVKVLELLLGFNMLEMISDSLITTYEVMNGTAPEILELILDHFLTDFLVQGIVILTLFFLFTFNDRLDVYPGYLVYINMFDRRKISFDKIDEVQEETLFKNVGTVYVKLKDQRNSLKVVYVVDFESKKKQLEEAIKSKKKKSS